MSLTTTSAFFASTGSAGFGGGCCTAGGFGVDVVAVGDGGGVDAGGVDGGGGGAGVGAGVGGGGGSGVFEHAHGAKTIAAANTTASHCVRTTLDEIFGIPRTCRRGGAGSVADWARDRRNADYRIARFRTEFRGASTMTVMSSINQKSGGAPDGGAS